MELRALPTGAEAAIRQIISSEDAMELTARMVRQKALALGIDLSAHKKEATQFMLAEMKQDESESHDEDKPQSAAEVKKKPPLSQRPANAPEPQKKATKKRTRPVSNTKPKDSVISPIELDPAVKRMRYNLKACGVSHHFSVAAIAAKSEVEYDETTLEGTRAKLKYVLEHYDLPTLEEITFEEKERFIALRELQELQDTNAVLCGDLAGALPLSKRIRRPPNQAVVPLSAAPVEEEPVVQKAANIAGWNSDESDSE